MPQLHLDADHVLNYQPNEFPGNYVISYDNPVANTRTDTDVQPSVFYDFLKYLGIINTEEHETLVHIAWAKERERDD